MLDGIERLREATRARLNTRLIRMNAKGTKIDTLAMVSSKSRGW